MIEIKALPGKTRTEFTELVKKAYSVNTHEFKITEEDKSLTAEINVTQIIETKVHLNLINDDLELKIDISPGINTDAVITFDDLMQRIEAIGVSTGLDMDRIKEAYKLYVDRYVVENITIAKGIKPIDGKNSELIQKAVLVEDDDKIDEQGRIDHKKTQSIINVNKGDLLLTKKPATHGVPGMTVTNVVVNPREGEDISVVMGEGVTSDEMGRNFYADIDGHFVFKGSMISVNPIFKAREVNYATGNIKFNGTVHISGDVLSGFEVEAQNDIIVEGICEDCCLTAGGDIIIKRGIKGKENNQFHAGGDVSANYMEGANISAKGNIYVKQYAFNCNLTSGGEIVATEGKGIIAGGDIRAYSMVEVNQLGADGSLKFNIAVGYKFDHTGKIDDLYKEIDNVMGTLKQVNHTLSKLNLKNPAVVKNPKVVKMLKLGKELDAKKSRLDSDLKELERQFKHPKPKIRILKKIENGNSVQFYKYKITVRENMKDTAFFFDPQNERIGWVSLSELEENSDLLND